MFNHGNRLPYRNAPCLSSRIISFEIRSAQMSSALQLNIPSGPVNSVLEHIINQLGIPEGVLK